MIVERAARAAALALVVLAIWRVVLAQRAPAEPVRIDALTRDELRTLTTHPVRALYLALDRMPDVVERDWLVALRRAGSLVAWSNAGMPAPTAIALTAIADPTEPIAIAVATTGTDAVTIADTLGVIDSVVPRAFGARVVTPSVQGSVTVRRSGATAARAHSPTARRVRPLLVTGSAGWETKFIIAALEERGWTVHSRIRVSPTAEVTRGPRTRIDTATYSAVIVTDSAGAGAAATLVAYARQGGGIVLAGDAARVPGLAGVAPARPGAPVPGSLLRAASSDGRAGLPMVPLANLRGDAVVLDEREGRPVAAARREGAGRVLMIGETETWRWRMAGGADGPAEHRRWWAGVVASVAYAPAADTARAHPEAAPYAALVDALGEPVTLASTLPASPPATPPAWLGASILGLLLLEWALRRLRGER